jgi:hypothetical protein
LRVGKKLPIISVGFIERRQLARRRRSVRAGFRVGNSFDRISADSTSRGVFAPELCYESLFTLAALLVCRCFLRFPLLLGIPVELISVVLD